MTKYNFFVPMLMLGLVFFLMGTSVPPRNAHTDWFMKSKYGLMTHNLARWAYTETAPGIDTTVTAEEFNRLVNQFDVKRFAEDLEAVGAGYVIFGLGQSSGFYCAPNPVYDQYLKDAGITKDYTAERDLPMEIYRELAPRGIKMLFYISNGGERNPEVNEALQWPTKKFGGQIRPFREDTKEKWETILAWWGTHYGPKLAGWWHDSMHWPDWWKEGKPHDFRTLTAKMKAGNPGRIVCFNYGLNKFIKLSDAQDYLAGEENQLSRFPESRWQDGMQWHMLSFQGDTWFDKNCRFSDQTWIDYIKKCNAKGGVVSIGYQNNPDGSIPEAQKKQLLALKKALR